MIVDDFVMLGRTVPEPTSRKDLYVCSAGVSPSAGGLLRLYPLTVLDKFRRWDVATVDLSGKARDSRRETRALGPAGFQVTGTVKPKERADLLAPYFVGSIGEADDRRMSLALLPIPRGWEFQLDRNPGEAAPHYEIWGPRPPKARERFEFTPRLRFDDAGSHRRLQVRDWGVWELMRKQEGVISQMGPDEQVSYVGGGLHITDQSVLFVGNNRRYRNAWLIISVLNGCLTPTA